MPSTQNTLPADVEQLGLYSNGAFWATCAD